MTDFYIIPIVTAVSHKRAEINVTAKCFSFIRLAFKFYMLVFERKG